MRTLLFACLLAAASGASANFDKGMEALKRGNADAALTELRAAAQSGDVRAYAPLARVRLQTARSVADLREAKQWADKGAAAGNADAQFVVYAATVAQPELNYVDAQGKVDAQRYKALAARPITEREDEMTAYDMLGKAAAQGHEQARLSLAGYLADSVGEGNRRRAIALLDGFPKQPPPFDQLRRELGTLEALGPTLAAVRVGDRGTRLVDDALEAGRVAALAAAAEKDRTKKDCAAVKPLKTQRVGPIEKAVWLPLAGADLKQSYLMQGNWREIWTFDVCGAETAVMLAFTADGLGGANVTAPKQ